MKRLLLTAACAFGLVFSTALAQEKTQEQLREESGTIFYHDGLKNKSEEKLLVLAAALQFTPLMRLPFSMCHRMGVAKACGWKADDPAHVGSAGCAIPFPSNRCGNCRGCHVVISTDLEQQEVLTLIQWAVDACLAGEG